MRCCCAERLVVGGSDVKIKLMNAVLIKIAKHQQLKPYPRHLLHTTYLYKVCSDLNSTKYQIKNNLNRHKMNTIKTLTRYALYTVLVAVALSCDEKTYKTEIVPNSEFTYQGCDYIKHGHGITHKGNCTNEIHKSNCN